MIFIILEIMPKIGNKKITKLITQFKEEGFIYNVDNPFCQYRSETINVDGKHQKSRLE